MSYFSVAVVPKHDSGGTVNPSDPTAAASAPRPAPRAATHASVVVTAHLFAVIFLVVEFAGIVVDVVVERRVVGVASRREYSRNYSSRKRLFESRSVDRTMCTQ